MCVCVCKQMHRSPQLGTRLQHGMVLQHWMASKSFWPEWRRIRDESIWLCRQKRWPWKNWSTGVCSHVPTHSRALAFTHSHRPLAHTPNSLCLSQGPNRRQAQIQTQTQAWAQTQAQAQTQANAEARAHTKARARQKAKAKQANAEAHTSAQTRACQCAGAAGSCGMVAPTSRSLCVFMCVFMCVCVCASE
jgi:hypothetical protein